MLSIRQKMEEISHTDELKRIKTIVEYLRKGSRKAASDGYAWFVRRYSKSIMDFTSRMLSSRADAQDTAQSVFIKAFGALEKFEGRSSFLSWLTRIAYNESVNLLKRRKIHFVSIDEMAVSGAEIPEEEFSTGDEERICHLEKALGELPPDEKMLVHLYYYKDMPLKEIAFITDCTAENLAVRLHRIRKKLSEKIKSF